MLQVVLSVLVLGELGYVIAANALLNLGAAQGTLRVSSEVQFHYARAWTLIPGRVHVEHVRLSFEDFNLQFSLDAERLDLDIAVRPLLSKTFHVTRLRGEGLVFKVRQRVLPADVHLATTHALPRLAAFDTPALLYPNAIEANRTDLWKIHVDDVDVGVVDIWAEYVRYLGSGRAQGAFALHAGHHLRVGPATLQLEPGELRLGQRRLAPRVMGRVECVVHPFFVNQPAGREIFAHISASIELRAEDLNLEPLDLFLPAGVAASAPGAQLHVSVRVKRGVFDEQSRITLAGDEARVDEGGFTFRGQAFQVLATKRPAGLGQLSFVVHTAAASYRGEAESFARLEQGTVELVSTSVDLAADWALEALDVGLVRLEVPALSRLSRITEARGLHLSEGSARLDGDGEYSKGMLRGRAKTSRLCAARPESAR